jgi:hypothetical protein
MNIIMSLWTKPCVDGKKHGFNSIEAMMESLILSANVAKKNYPELHFYTDELGYEWITPYLDQLPFTKIEVCLDDFNWVPETYWSFVKMCVYSLQKEPFIHIDNDVFLWDKIPDSLTKGKDFLFERLEDATHDEFTFYQTGLKTYSEAIHPEFKFHKYAVNCGVFGCLTDRAFSLLPKYLEFGKYFIDRAELSKTIQTESISNRMLASVVIEQLYIYSLIMMNKLSYGVILNQDVSPLTSMRYSHMLSSNKRNPVIERKVKERVFLKLWD